MIIVARHFPPEISGGVRRWHILSQELVALGHAVTVVAPDLGHEHGNTDQNLPFDVIRVPHPAAQNAQIIKPSKVPRFVSIIASLKDLVRQIIRVPDPDIGWAKAVANHLYRVCENKSFDWIITSAPPESLHFIGRSLKGSIAKHWLADMRDYWLQYPLTKIREKPHRRRQEARLAKKWLAAADLITAVDAGMADEAALLSGQSATVLENFSPSHANWSGKIDFLGPKKSIRFLHTGSFSLSDQERKIAPVLAAFETALQAKSDISLHLIGRLTQEEIVLVQRSSAKAAIFLYGTRPSLETLAFQKLADALIMTAAPTAPSVPGKISEYIAAKRPIILIGDGPWKARHPTLPSGLEAIIQAANGALPIPDTSILTAKDAAFYLAKKLTNISRETP